MTAGLLSVTETRCGGMEEGLPAECMPQDPVVTTRGTSNRMHMLTIAYHTNAAISCQSVPFALRRYSRRS